MNKEIVETSMLAEYRQYLIREERSLATIDKYLRDVRAFQRFMQREGELSKEAVIRYKQELNMRYAVSSANSMLVSLNGFLAFIGRGDCRVKLFRTQRKGFRCQERELSKEEYLRLLETAKSQGNKRLALLMQTICSTGIRVSELKYIDVEAVKRGNAHVNCKGKCRMVFLPKQLRQSLQQYCREQGLRSGCIFITKTGRPMDRSNIWRTMKRLCRSIHISPNKVFPHNLRHLFAYTYYKIKKDIVRLADILGHASVETTRIYTLTSGAEHQRDIACLGFDLLL